MNDIQKFLAVLPDKYHGLVEEIDDLIEIVLDLGRPLILRYQTYKVKIPDIIVDKELLKEAIDRIGAFGPDNRAGINGTLHRISRIQSRTGETIGLTCRFGRVFESSEAILKDLVLSGENILLMGRPGKGKTTLLRGIAKFLADECNKSVVIVDSSNEIAGDGDVPHEGVGDSRRLQVPLKRDQHSVMIEAVQNHTPDVIIIDEMGVDEEVAAARTIAQRGVQLIATAHGRKLDDLMKNPPLKGLIGGVRSVTVSDKRAEETGTDKQILVREESPTFNVLVELVDFGQVNVYLDVEQSVDAILKGGVCRPERRKLVDGVMTILEPYRVMIPNREERREQSPQPQQRERSSQRSGLRKRR